MRITKNFQGVGSASHPRLSGAARRTIGTTEPDGDTCTTEGDGGMGATDADGDTGTTEREGGIGATVHAPTRVTAITAPAARRVNGDACPRVTG